MKAWKSYLLFFLGMIFCTASIRAQLFVADTGLYANQNLLVSDLFGSQVSYIGTIQQISSPRMGFFRSVQTNLGLDSGIVLSSGSIFNAPGMNNSTNMSSNNLLVGDPDLDILLYPTISYDAAVLEFDFIPVVDTIRIQWVFGSDEYPEYVASTPGGINDGFGVFVSGPGINGPFTNQGENFAITPDGVPFTMYSLNCNPQNSPYYICNDPVNSQSWNYPCPSSYSCPLFPAQTTLKMDGFTIPVESRIPVDSGMQYHMRIAIGDGGDRILDSWVFLASPFQRPSGISESENVFISLFPNPNYGQLFVTGVNEPFRIEVVNTLGGVVMTATGSGKQPVDISQLANGIYFVKIEAKDFCWNGKINLVK